MIFHGKAPSIIGGQAPLNLIADQHVPLMKRNYLAQMVRLQNRVNRRELSDLIRQGAGTDIIINSLPISDILGSGLPQKGAAPKTPFQNQLGVQFQAILTAAGDYAVQDLGAIVPGLPAAPPSMALDQAAWAASHSASTVQGVSTATRNAIRATVTTGIIQGLPPDTVARNIQQVIGLTTAQASKLLKFGDRLAANGVPLSEVASRLAGVKEGMLTSRALTIARTETINAANGGQQLLWKIALNDGILEDDKVRKKWIITPDDRLDLVVCAPMPDMEENQDVRVGDVFITGGGWSVEHPTAHPNCRCAVGLVVLD